MLAHHAAQRLGRLLGGPLDAPVRIEHDEAGPQRFREQGRLPL